MSGTDEEFLRTLRATFKIEAREHLQTMQAGLLQLPGTTEPAEQLRVIETVFRAAHSLKGAARAVNFISIESLCQSLEDLFASWKRRERAPTAETLSSARHSLETMAEALDEPERPQTTEPTPRAAPPAATVAASAPARSVGPIPSAAASLSVSAPEIDTVRVAVKSLDACLLEAEEMLAAKLLTGQRAADLDGLLESLRHWHKEWAGLPPRTRTLLQTLENRLTALRQKTQQDRLLVGKLVEDLLTSSKKLLMLPFATLGTLLQKVVRDLCRDQGKEAELSVRGGEITLDKRILEELKDPLIHALRNCIDHGIETPEQRRQHGKPPRAAIVISVAAFESTQVEISVTDDGAGIDVVKLKQAAVERGVIAADAAGQLAEDAAQALVFEADVSTSPMITRVSGRGLGLAIAREKSQKLGGRIAVESRRGQGTTVRMTVPLTLATFRGVLLRASERVFIVPTLQVDCVARFRPQDVRTIEGRNTLLLNGKTLALVELAEVLQLPAPRRPATRAASATATRPVAIVGAGEQRVAFAVDAVLDEREVLVKRLEKPLSRVRNVAAASVLSSGEVAIILNVNDLIKSARSAGNSSGVTAGARATTAPLATSASKRILVAEDSITSRILLKGILEAGGYQVTTAVDGMEAFTTLRAESFDLLVSDVEMPRMNGFDLTARIRAERHLAELPVVLVTALESREDREHGIDVGANAYLVKSSLDQSNLLEAVGRLV